MALFLDVGPDDVVHVGDDLLITVERKSGSRARLRFDGAAAVELVKRGRFKLLDDEDPDDGRRS
jgi:hypothetical protein